jgi:hypothetical protein
MSNTLYDRINAILGRDCPAIGGVSAEAIDVIREMEARLEDANQLFQDVSDMVDLDSQLSRSAYRGMEISDSVANYDRTEAT